MGSRVSYFSEMLATEPVRNNSMFCANVTFDESKFGTWSTPFTEASPAPPLTVGISELASSSMLSSFPKAA